MRTLLPVAFLSWLAAASLLATTSVARANVPAAYWACEGARNGAECRYLGGLHGACVLDFKCDDNADTDVDECLICRDPCGGKKPHTRCVMDNGEFGVCTEQPDCEPNPDTSFDECNLCVEGEATEVDGGDDDRGCQAVDATASLPWLLVLFGLTRASRRRRE